MHNIPILLLLLQLMLGPIQVSEDITINEPYVLREEVPILMYHEIGTPSGPWKELYVEPETFAKQLDWLEANSYTTVALADVYSHWYKKTPLPEKPIVITFDDGYLSMYEKVMPLLLSKNMQATFFLYPSKFGLPTGLTPEMVVSLAQNGMEIGSHTYSHIDLTKASSQQLKKELLDSKTLLEELTKKPIDFLCYPAGKFNSQVITEAEKYGYQAAVTTQMGKASVSQSPLQWKRVRINYSDGLTGFIKKVQ